MICIGYDYGTTNSIVTRYVSGDNPPVKVIRKSPSAIQDGDIYVRSPKRFLSQVPIDERGRRYLAEFSYGMLKQALSYTQENEPVFITVSVPNAYKDNQCKLVLDTIRYVGSEILTESRFNPHSIAIIPEPIAAALQYVMTEADNVNTYGIVCICDIGGGTTDLAIVKYTISGEINHKHIEFKVLCTAPGNDALGGDDIDKIMATELCNRYDLKPEMYSEKTLNAACRALKIKLSTHDSASVVLTGPDEKHPARNENGDVIELSSSRTILNRLLYKEFIPKFEEQLNLLRDAFAANPIFMGNKEIADYNLRWGAILPIGGTSQIPLLQEIMSQKLGGKIIHFSGESANPNGVAPYDSVARGAAIYSAWLNNELSGVDSIVIEGRTMHTISVEVNRNELVTIVGRNMPSGEYLPGSTLFPLVSEVQGTTFKLKRINLYEGEGSYVGDTRFGPAPQPLLSQHDKLTDLSDPIFTHGRPLSDITVEIRLNINDQGRLASLVINVPEGQSDRSDYTKTIEFVQ